MEGMDGNSAEVDASHAPQLQLPEELGHDLGLLPPLSRQTSAHTNTIRPTPSRSQSFADRISSLTPSRDFRSFTGSWRRRRSPAPTPELDSSAALSRLLSVAAAATAATLMGGNVDNAINDLRAASGEVEGEDGTFSSFLQTLRSGRLTGLTQGNRNGTNGMNTFRMFRFGSAPGTLASSNQSTNSQSTQQDTQGQPVEQRMIPVLIVGIRAFTGDTEASQENGEGVPSFFSGLPANMDIDTTNGSHSSSRPGRRRRMSLGGSTLPTTRDTFRRLRPSLNTRPRSFAAISELPERSIGTQTEATPLNTPALNETITSLPSTSSIPLLAGQSRRRDFETALDSAVADDAESPSPRPTRRRRLSDSDTPRYGAGSPRRNGVLVEPLDAPPAEGHRSWIIYILGGSYPADHPILTTPSLFTDSPTYEDMIRLSTLLGPAKPPVANAEDVAAAPGVLKIKISDGVVYAIGDGDEAAIVVPGERCLVCLCDYEEREEVRQLMKCSHFFHRECIDQVCAIFMW